MPKGEQVLYAGREHGGRKIAMAAQDRLDKFGWSLMLLEARCIFGMQTKRFGYTSLAGDRPSPVGSNTAKARRQ